MKLTSITFRKECEKISKNKWYVFENLQTISTNTKEHRVLWSSMIIETFFLYFNFIQNWQRDKKNRMKWSWEGRSLNVRTVNDTKVVDGWTFRPKHKSWIRVLGMKHHVLRPGRPYESMELPRSVSQCFDTPKCTRLELSVRRSSTKVENKT